jgi:8-amino-7-oxononanoate synthase
VSAAARAALASGAATPTGSQILPVIVGDDRAALTLAAGLQRRGFDVRAIRPPTVPMGTARLRISITLNVDAQAVAALFAALAAERDARAA